MDYKGDNDEDNNLDNKITDTFNTLVVNIDPDTLLDKDDQAIVYYTLYGEIKLDNITAIALELVNRVYSYIVITIDTMTDVFPTNIDPFVYNITLHYTSIKFIGIIINTKASKRSTAGYSQFFALQKIDKVQLNESIRGIVGIQFGIGSISSIGFIKVATPIGIVEFHIVKVDIFCFAQQIQTIYKCTLII